MLNKFAGLALLMCAGTLLAQEPSPSATAQTIQQPADGPALIKQKNPRGFSLS